MKRVRKYIVRYDSIVRKIWHTLFYQYFSHSPSIGDETDNYNRTIQACYTQ